MLKFNWKKLGFSTSEKEFSNATRLAVVARFKLEKAKKQSDKQLIASLEKAVKQQKTVHFLFLTPTVENTHKQKRPVEGALHGLLFSSGISRPPLLPISYLVLMQKKIPVVIITDNSDVERFAFF